MRENAFLQNKFTPESLMMDKMDSPRKSLIDRPADGFDRRSIRQIIGKRRLHKRGRRYSPQIRGPINQSPRANASGQSENTNEMLLFQCSERPASRGRSGRQPRRTAPARGASRRGPARGTP